MELLDIYTDGACEKNGLTGPRAGWAFIVTKHNSDEIVLCKKGKVREGEQHSNRAELEAMYQALKFCRQEEHCFTIYTDSEVVENGINGKARRKANRDIWEDIEYACFELKNVIVKKIEGHQDEATAKNNIQAKMNKMTDELAKQAARCLLNNEHNGGIIK